VRRHVCKSIGLLVTAIKQKTKKGFRAVTATATLTKVTIEGILPHTTIHKNACFAHITNSDGPNLYVVEGNTI
jgi:hypothetical protein